MAKQIDPRKAPKGIKALIYGPPGAGKTRLVATAAQDQRSSPALLLDAGGNPSSLQDYDPAPTILRIEELPDFNDPYDWFMRDQPKDDPLVKAFGLKPPYRSVIVDQVTEVQRMYFDRVWIGKLGPGDIPAKRTWDHFNLVLGSTLNFIRCYYELADQKGIMVWMTALEREANTDQGRPIGPALEGQSFTEIGGYANLVGRLLQYTQLDPKVRRLVDQEVQTILSFKRTEHYIAKDQVSNGRLSATVENPTIGVLLDGIYG